VFFHSIQTNTIFALSVLIYYQNGFMTQLLLINFQEFSHEKIALVDNTKHKHSLIILFVYHRWFRFQPHCTSAEAWGNNDRGLSQYWSPWIESGCYCGHWWWLLASVDP